MLACDQSRIPPGRSIRFTSSSVNGAYFARHDQKSFANFCNESACVWLLANRASALRKTAAQKRVTAALSIGASVQRDDRRRQTRPIHRHAGTERGGFVARVTNTVQFIIPALNIRAVRCFVAAGNG